MNEEYGIVYHEPTLSKLGGTEASPKGDWREALEPNLVLLFCYSTMTFNDHRTHYNWPYVTDAEGYSGLAVHGLLIATLALRVFCRANP